MIHQYNYTFKINQGKRMKRFIMALLVLATALFAEVTHQPLDTKLLNSGIQIVDIRTPAEWKQTGIVKGSVPIMFFDERGGYNVDAFLKELNSKIDTSKKFALICRTGSRTKLVANFLSKNLAYNVINLQGGIMNAMRQQLPIEPLPAKK